MIPVLDRRFYSLIDKVYDLRNLHEAWKEVKRNKGAAGVDRVTIQRFEENLERYLKALHERLKAGTYTPPPVRRVYIDKADGTKRPLGIPTVADRVVQQAVRRVLNPIFEAVFLPCSHGFRPGRSTRSAIVMVEEYRKQGFRWVVDVDFKSYFDTLDQMNGLKKHHCVYVFRNEADSPVERELPQNPGHSAASTVHRAISKRYTGGG